MYVGPYTHILDHSIRIPVPPGPIFRIPMEPATETRKAHGNHVRKV